jgi:hypothetical protein
MARHATNSTSGPKPPKIPPTAVELAAKQARAKLWTAITTGADINAICALADSAIDCARVAESAEAEFFSLNDLATRYALSRKTVESWKLPRHRFGNSIRFSRADVLAFEAENRATA